MKIDRRGFLGGVLSLPILNKLAPVNKPLTIPSGLVAVTTCVPFEKGDFFAISDKGIHRIRKNMEITFK